MCAGARSLAWLLLFSSLAAPAFALVTVPAPFHEPIDLSGTWLFQTGDDPAYARPDFPDAAWQRVQVPVPWGRQGHRGYAGLAWYRLHVQVPEDALRRRDALR